MRVNKLIVLLISIFTCGIASAEQGSEEFPHKPANPQASAEAAAILDYLHSLPEKADRKIISGQFECWGKAVKPLDDRRNWLNQVHRRTGKWVGLAGVEYHQGEVNPEKPNAVCLDYWKRGGLVQLYLIMSNPANPTSHNGGGKCDIDLVLEDGHAYNRHFFKELDQVAEGLEVLQENDVVVFVNMFAEMTENWFWWGGQYPQKYKKLHRATFEYLVKEKQLDNLLFVFEPSGFNKEAVSYYPGDDTVDMIGISLFVDSDMELEPGHIRMYDELRSLGKPMALSQWGPRRGKDQTGKEDQSPADNLKLLRGIKKYFPEICWWMNWNMAYAIAADKDSNVNSRELLKDPWVINREDLDWRANLPEKQ